MQGYSPPAPLASRSAASSIDVTVMCHVGPAAAGRLQSLPGPVAALVARYATAARRYAGHGRWNGLAGFRSELVALDPTPAEADAALAELCRLIGLPLRTQEAA